MGMISKEFVKRVFKFGLTSGVATAIDFALFTFVFSKIMPLFYAEILASFIGMVINFFLQKRYVFDLQRKAYVAFTMSIVSSILVMLLGAYVITQLVKIDYLEKHLFIAKIIIIGMKFGLNFFIKQWIFERKLIHKS